MCKLGGRATRDSEAAIGGWCRKSQRAITAPPPFQRPMALAPRAIHPLHLSLQWIPTRDKSAASSAARERPAPPQSRPHKAGKRQVDQLRLFTVSHPTATRSKSAKASHQGSPPTAIKGHIGQPWGPCIGRSRAGYIHPTSQIAPRPLPLESASPS